MTKLVNLDTFSETIQTLIVESKKLGLPNARISDLREIKVVIRAIRKARTNPQWTVSLTLRTWTSYPTHIIR